MAVLDICKFDSPVLREKAQPVRKVNNKVRKQLNDMLDTMRSASGVGLAAPQIGISRRMVVIDVGDGPYFLINPEFVFQSVETETKWEGCLSWPGYVGEVERPLRVSVKALDADGRDVWVEGEGLLARALCHELDHLDGILFVDRAISIMEAEPDYVDGDKDLSSLNCVFMGSPLFAVPALNQLVDSGIDVSLVVTQPNRPYGRKQILTPTPVKKRAIELGLKVFTPDAIGTSQSIEKLTLARPDFIAVVAYGQKLPNSIIELPKYACLNVHPSLLPKYRGGNPIQRQIMAGEQTTGVSVILMGEQMDAGDICFQKSLKLEANETFGELENRLSIEGAQALVETIWSIYTGSAECKSQKESEATFAPHLKRGENVIDWKLSAHQIHNLVRALSPKPGAVTMFGNELTKIWRTQIMSLQRVSNLDRTVPGTVVKINGTMAIVKCGKGLLGVLEVQPAGKKTMAAAAFLAGRQKLTARFG